MDLVRARRLASVALIAALSLLVSARPALAHSQLVSSSPGAGQVLAQPPTELLLVFSEALEPGYSTVDLVDGQGRTLETGIGNPDPSDSRVLIVPVPGLADGAYTVVWRVLSTADGHETSGSITFGVGDVQLVSPGQGPSDAGHSHSRSTEVQGRLLSDLGFMIAFGLAVFAWAVLRPVTRRPPVRIARMQAVALVASGFGAILLALLGATTSDVDPAAFLIQTRTGQLLLGRVAVSMVGCLAVLGLARAGRPSPAIAVGAGSGLAGLTLMTLSGHISAYGNVASLSVMVLHLAAASIWVAGVIALADLAVIRVRHATVVFRELVPRFSALAVVSILLAAVTGFYSAWTQVRDVAAINSSYGAALGFKLLLAAAALGLGALNFLDRGRGRRWLGGLPRRLGVEALLAVGVVIAAGYLASDAPPAQSLPTKIATATGRAATNGLTLSIQPARPGPNRFLVEVPAPIAQAGSVELELQRLDRDIGVSTLSLHPALESGAGGGRAVRFIADGGQLAPNSRWDVTAVVRASDGREVARGRFVFGLDRSTLVEGRESPPIDPGPAVALGLIVLALLGGTYAVAGGTLPLTDPGTGRLAVIGGAAAGGLVGLLILAIGPRL